MLEIAVTEIRKLFGIAVCFQPVDVRQRHSVEGVILAGRVDRHVTEDEQISDVKFAIESIVTNDIA